ncbi:MAG TPA: YciI-like protein [Vicinamibacterales bacterium]
MPCFALFYDLVDNFIERRQPYRADHLALLDEAQRAGRLILAGPLQPADTALLVFRTDTASDVEAIVARDPYVTNGLVTSWRVREWTVVTGSAAANVR